MTRIAWDQVGSRYYEAGVDRGLLDVAGLNNVVPWNGLVAVTESPSGGNPTPYYIDGIKYSNEGLSEEFSGAVSAVTYPDEFGSCIGSYNSGSGLSVQQQRRVPFNLSYRTLIGDDISGTEAGYKIHLIYGAHAAPTSTGHETLSDDPDFTTFQWAISTKPSIVGSRRPFSHLTIDSRETDPARMQDLEDILYGTDTTDPRFPTPEELIEGFGPSRWLTNWIGDPNESMSELRNSLTGELLRRNIARNPNFSSTAGSSTATPIARRNLAENPVAEGPGGVPNASGYEATGATSSWTINSILTGSHPFLTRVINFRCTSTSDGSTGVIFRDGGRLQDSPAIPVGTKITVSFYAFTDTSFSGYIFLSQDGVGGVDGPNIQSPTIEFVATSNYQRFSYTFTTDTECYTPRSGVSTFSGSGTNFSIDDDFYIGGYTIELEDTLLPFVAPGYSQDANLDSSWVGTVGESESVGYAKGFSYPTVEGLRRQGFSSSAITGAGSSDSFMASGILEASGSCLAVASRYGNANYAYMDVGGSSSVSDLIFGNNDYRLSVKVIVLRPLSIGNPGVEVNTGTETVIENAPNVVGTHNITVYFSGGGLSSDPRWIRLVTSFNGTNHPSDVVYWDEFLLENITTGEPVEIAYFDGDTWPSVV